MHPTIIAATARNFGDFNTSDIEFRALVREAKAADSADRSLGVIDAMRKYRKAVCWAMFLGIGLIMEGYDFVIVS